MKESNELIYHITTPQEWKQALTQGYYEATSLHSEGFIHCSFARQVDGVLKRYFANKTELLKLVIDPLLLTSSCRYELSPLLNEEFPHIHGGLNLNAVIDVVYL